jgi:hypothetical protein
LILSLPVFGVIGFLHYFPPIRPQLRLGQRVLDLYLCA